jgi:hypothetical protein
MNEWTGDLKDDCHLDRYGYSAAVECMGRGDWWFAIYKGRKQIYNTADNHFSILLSTGKMARAAAECMLEKVANQ